MGSSSSQIGRPVTSRRASPSRRFCPAERFCAARVAQAAQVEMVERRFDVGEPVDPGPEVEVFGDRQRRFQPVGMGAVGDRLGRLADRCRAIAGCSPASVRRSVVLPDPFGPAQHQHLARRAA